MKPNCVIYLTPISIDIEFNDKAFIDIEFNVKGLKMKITSSMERVYTCS